MAERRAADEAGRQESLFEALEPPPARNPWAPPLEAPRHDDLDEAAPTAAEAPPVDAPDVDVAPHDAVEASSPAAPAPATDVPARAADVLASATHTADALGRHAGSPAIADDHARAPHRAGARLAGPTLDDVMSRVWEGLVTGLPAACPVCHGEVAPSLGGPLLGRCSSCGTAID